MCAECEKLRDKLNEAMDALEGLMEELEACDQCAHDRAHLGCALVQRDETAPCEPLWKGRAGL